MVIEPVIEGKTAMSITIEAIYENGVLRPTRPLPLKEQEIVRITIEPEQSWADRHGWATQVDGRSRCSANRRGGRVQHSGVDLTFATSLTVRRFFWTRKLWSTTSPTIPRSGPTAPNS